MPFRERQSKSCIYKQTKLNQILTAILVYMPSYEFAQQTLTNYYGDKELLGIRHVLAGSIAGLCGSFVKVPVDVVKKRLQAGMYPNILIAISSIASDGIGGSHNKPWSSMRMFYSGWRSSILYDIPFNAVQFTVLENVKRCMRRYRRNETFLQSDHVVVGALTGLITSVITEPVCTTKKTLIYISLSFLLSNLLSIHSLFSLSLFVARCYQNPHDDAKSSELSSTRYDNLSWMDPLHGHNYERGRNHRLLERNLAAFSMGGREQRNLVWYISSGQTVYVSAPKKIAI